MKKISIVIPAYNEEKAIGHTLKEINDTLKNINIDYEIIVIDNNSIDRTGDIAKDLGAHVILEKRQGYGNAYKCGLKKASGDIIITGDADGTYPFNKIPYFLELIEKESLDFINTNRFGMMRDGSMSFLHKFGNGVLTLWFNILFSNKIKDSQSGMWIFRKKVIDKLNFDIMDGGMPFSQEIKAFACLYGFNVKEIPIEYRSRIGKAKLNTFKDGFRNLYKLFVFKAKLLKLK
jgi:glycosyltransferase involved in cell wall biosynthesis